MADVYNDYRRKSTSVREDPRLARRDRSTSGSDRPKQLYDKLGVPISPTHKSQSSSPPRDPRVREQNWPNHQPPSQYNQTLQTSYQHLPQSMYGEHNQYSTQGYQNSYPTYQQNYGTAASGYNPYQGYGQTQTGYNSGNMQPGPPGEEYPQGGWAPVGGGYPNLSQPPPQHPVAAGQPAATVNDSKNDEHKKEAVAQELKQQKAQLIRQRDEYVHKVVVLRRELELLRTQKQELLAEQSPEHDNDHILRENGKLQIEIQNKMKAIYNVIEMLSGILGDGVSVSELENQFKEDSPKQKKEKEQRANVTRRSVSSEKSDKDVKYNFVHYDPELHWCRICDVFPKSAKDLLMHLHSKEHRQVTQERDMVDTPWHKLPPEPEFPFYEGAPKKRLPIKGLQFFISSTAWYCKLCDTWIGDLHCASQHLKSQTHNQNYTNFVEQNPHWEIEWLKDREKAVARTTKNKGSDSDETEKNDNHEKRKKKRKDRRSPLSSGGKDKKKKKRSKKRKKQSSDSSSSSSSSDTSTDDENNDKSKSIRVAMRNKMKLQAQMIMSEDLGGKWEVLGRLVEEERKRKEAASAPEKDSGSDDNLINQWMTVSEPQEKDKHLLNSIKDRMKQKQEAEKAKKAELEKQKIEKEKKEKELKEKAEREAKEKEETQRRQQEELERQREREREQIRFKTKEAKKRDSPSPSADHKRYRHHSPSKHRSERRRSRSYDGRGSPDDKRHKRDDKDSEDSKKDRRSSGSSKRLPFIGRMPLFKNKKFEDKVEKEIKKEDYDIPRQTRFQPGNLARAFIPEPDVVCFPKLSSIPPLSVPPPPSILQSNVPKLKPPPAPIINSFSSEDMDVEDQVAPAQEDEEEEEEEVEEFVEEIAKKVEIVPPPPTKLEGPHLPRDFQDALSIIYPDPSQMGMEAMMAHYQYNMDYNMMYSQQMYDYSQDVAADEAAPPPPEDVPIEHTMPLQPPPLPPDDPSDDLAMLGISADDMAAQMF